MTRPGLHAVLSRIQGASSGGQTHTQVGDNGVKHPCRVSQSLRLSAFVSFLVIFCCFLLIFSYFFYCLLYIIYKKTPQLLAVSPELFTV